MAVKKVRPNTPGQRFRIAPVYDQITTDKPEKSLLVTKKKTGGRNSKGRMTVRYKGGGHKQKYRIIDFKRDNHDAQGKVASIEYDPNRTAFIALVVFQNGEKRYILAPEGLKVDDKVISGAGAAPEKGNAMPLSNVPTGMILHNIELRPGKGGVMARSAGSSVQLVAKDGKFATLKLPSGEMRNVLSTCFATIGVVSNGDHMNVILGKAGRKRWLGRRPRTRGVAMNPVDHPMGGGEGKSSGGQPRSRTGLYSKGKKTRKPNKYSDRLIIGKNK